MGTNNKHSQPRGKKPVAQRVYLLDASVYVFRAWFALPDRFHAPDGRPVNAVYGYTRFLLEFLEGERPVHVAAAFDESLTSSFRNRIYPAYKANREPAPPELKEQFRLCQRITRALGVPVYSSTRYEADDLIGTLAEHARSAGQHCVLLTRDKDLAQLLAPGDLWWDYAAGQRHDQRGVREKFGVDPAQLADYLALVGDSVDNIPGVPGVGPKAAAALLAFAGGLDGLYARLDAVPSLPLRGAAALANRLAAHRKQAFLSRELARIRRDVPLRRIELRRRPANRRALARFCTELGFGAGLPGRLETLDAP